MHIGQALDLVSRYDSLRNPLTSPVSYYTSDAADERSSVDLGGRRIIKKKKKKKKKKKQKKKKKRTR